MGVAEPSDAMAGAGAQTRGEVREGTSHWRQARELPAGGRMGAG